MSARDELTPAARAHLDVLGFTPDVIDDAASIRAIVGLLRELGYIVRLTPASARRARSAAARAAVQAVPPP